MGAFVGVFVGARHSIFSIDAQFTLYHDYHFLLNLTIIIIIIIIIIILY
jgi:hypothetical protein